MTTKQLVMIAVIVAYVLTPAAAPQTTSDCSDHTLATQGISLYYKTCDRGHHFSCFIGSSGQHLFVGPFNSHTGCTLPPHRP